MRQTFSDYRRRRLWHVVPGHPGDATDSYSKLGLAFAFAVAATYGVAVWIVQGLTRDTGFGLTFDLKEELRFGLAVGLAGGLAFALSKNLPSEANVKLHGQFWKSLPFGLVFGIAAGSAVGLAYGIVAGPVVGLAVGPVVGLALALVYGIVYGFIAPADTARAVSPSSVLRRDRLSALLGALAGSLIVGLVSALTIMLAYALSDFLRSSRSSQPLQVLTNGLRIGGQLGFSYGPVVGIVIGFLIFGASAWSQYFLTQVCMVATRKLPYPLISFLDEAHQRGVLRQVGAVYQFRHARLRDRLAAIPMSNAGETREPSSRGQDHYPILDTERSQ